MQPCGSPYGFAACSTITCQRSVPATTANSTSPYGQVVSVIEHAITSGGPFTEHIPQACFPECLGLGQQESRGDRDHWSVPSPLSFGYRLHVWGRSVESDAFASAQGEVTAASPPRPLGWKRFTAVHS